MTNFAKNEYIAPLALKNQSLEYENNFKAENVLQEINKVKKNNPDMEYTMPALLELDDGIVPNGFKAIGGKIDYNLIFVHIPNAKEDNASYYDSNNQQIKKENAKVEGFANYNKKSICINLFVLAYERGSNDFVHKKMKNIAKTLSVIFHELKHITNHNYKEARLLNPKSKKMSPENLLKWLEDDEKSATIDAGFRTLDRYADKELYKSLSDAEKTRGSIMFRKETIDFAKEEALRWEEEYKESYTNKQFKAHMRKMSLEYPTHKISDNNNCEEPEYLYARKLVHTYERYNPYTGKTEYFNLADVIAHAKISANEEKEIIEPFKKQVAERKKHITPEMMQDALKTNKKTWEESRLNKPTYPQAKIYKKEQQR